MHRNQFETELGRFLSESAENRIAGTDVHIFETPLIGVAAAGDPLFIKMKNPELVGERFLLPEEWLPGAKSVISVFFPFSETVRKSNRGSGKEIGFEWLYGRIEGQRFLEKTMLFLSRLLADAGISNVVPQCDPRYLDGVKEELYTSNWSERHVAFVAGLGTFGLSRGLITRRGMAGRFGSLISAEKWKPDERDYEEVYEYCSRCGACVKNCPSGSIALEGGKDHTLCRAFMEETKKTYSPRFGCGKCQVGVPCESRVPNRNNASEK